MQMHQQRISFSRKRFLEEAANRLFLGIAVVFYVYCAKLLCID